MVKLVHVTRESFVMITKAVVVERFGAVSDHGVVVGARADGRGGWGGAEQVYAFHVLHFHWHFFGLTREGL